MSDSDDLLAPRSPLPGPGRRRQLVVLGIVIVVTIAAVIGRGWWDDRNAAGDGEFAITQMICTVGPTRLAAHSTIANTTKQRRAFQVQVTFHEPDGNEIAEARTATPVIAPFTAAPYSVSIAHRGAPAGTTCDLTEVNDVDR